MVNGVGCETKIIDKIWYVVVNKVSCKLYRIWVKGKGKKNGRQCILKIKGICEVCEKEFFGFLNTQRQYCSKKCSSRVNAKLSCINHISLSNSKKLKQKARDFVKCKILTGEMIRPEVCSNCSCHGNIIFHHPNYDKPNEGMWWCRSCHGKFHFGHEIKGKLVVYNI